MPGRPPPLSPQQIAAIKRRAEARKKYDGVKPGTAPSPVKSLVTPGVTDVKVSGMHVGTVQVAALRNFLRTKGYDLPKTNSGVGGRRLLSALNDWGVANLPAKKFGGTSAVGALLGKYHSKANGDSGRQKPQQWNTAFSPKSKVAAPVNTLIDRGGNPTPQARANGAYDPGALTADAGAVGSVPIDEDLSKSGASLLDGNKLADALAGLQYDSQIRDLAHQGDVNKLQTTQNESDIGSWYDQALASLKTAGTRDAAITQAGKDSVKGADAAILASLGGDASGGASTVASAQAAGEGTLAALGTAQDQYNQDIQPIVTQERAGQLTGEQAKGTSRAADLAIQLANAKGERGGSVASHLMDIREYNNTIKDNQLQRLLQIKAANSQQDQQAFQNTLAIQQANLAALATGAKFQAAAKKPAKGSFGDTPASVKAQLASTIFRTLDSRVQGGLTLQQAQALVAARLTGAGWNTNNPHVAQYGQAVLNNWAGGQ
jgi:hypothetical protein